MDVSKSAATTMGLYDDAERDLLATAKFVVC